ncbi:MAG: DUF2071 domain-containing protein [Chloroflexota bacterium]
MPLTSQYQAWRRLLFVHWAVDPAVLQPRMPRGTAVDAFDGQAYVGLVLFAIPSLRPPIGPMGLRLAFLEANVRTYVRGPDGTPGVYFFSLDAGSRLAVLGAGILTGLPYYFARGGEEVHGEHVTYALTRHARPHPRVHARYRMGPLRGPAAPGTLAHFLVERYRLFVQRGPATFSVDVRHTPYPLHDVHVETLEDSLVSASGIRPDNHAPDHVTFASGVDVAIGLPRLLRA